MTTLTSYASIERFSTQTFDIHNKAKFDDLPISHIALSEKGVAKFLEELLESNLQTETDFYERAKKLLTLVLSCRERQDDHLVFEKLSPIFSLLLSHQYLAKSSVSKTYLTVLSLWFDFDEAADLQDLTDFNLKFPDKHSLPNLLEKMALTALFLRRKFSKIVASNFVQKALDLSQLYNPEKQIGAFLWTKEKSFNPITTSLLSYVIFNTAYTICPIASLQSHAKWIQNSIDNLLDSSSQLDLLSFLIYKRLDSFQTVKTIASEIFSEKTTLNTLGVQNFFGLSLDVQLAISGESSPLGSLRKGGVEVPAIGPHFPPLGQMSRFGISRQSYLKERSYKDLSFDDNHFQGWTKLSGTNNWLFLSFEQKKESVRFNFELEEGQKKIPYITFFIKAEEAIIANNYQLLPASLDRYSGPKESVSFYFSGSCLTVEPIQCSMMQLIPLENRSHFWGASFLLALSFDQHETLSVEFS